MNILRTLSVLIVFPASVCIATIAAAADNCTQNTSPIATDRPDVTNSSVVVPVGSFQSENGINLSRHDGGEVFDGTNSRLRLGIAPCLEVLVDIPNYTNAFRGLAASGFGDVAPAVKWQISPVPGKVDLSMTIGAALDGRGRHRRTRRAALSAVPVVGRDHQGLEHQRDGDEFLHPR